MCAEVIFDFCYIPPNDPPYFTFQSSSAVQEKIADKTSDNTFCVVGDDNAMFGRSVGDFQLIGEIRNSDSYTYPHISDDVPTPNDIAHFLLSLCSGNALLVLNNLQTRIKYFPRKKTFKKGEQWLSELDAAVVSHQLVQYVVKFDVYQTDWLASDHVPISLDMIYYQTLPLTLLARVSYLGGHTSLQGQLARAAMVNTCRRFKFVNMDIVVFPDVMSNNLSWKTPYLMK